MTRKINLALGMTLKFYTNVVKEFLPHQFGRIERFWV